MKKILPLLILGAALILFGVIFSSDDAKEAKTGLTDEESLAVLCSSIEGVGECSVRVNYGEEGKVYAVAVVCNGAENSEVRARLIDLFTSLYGIGANRVTVLKNQR